MSLKGRAEKHEKGRTTSRTLHCLYTIRAREGETVMECVTRVAAENGLTLAQIGKALSTSIGYMCRDDWVIEHARHARRERKEREKLAKNSTRNNRR